MRRYLLTVLPLLASLALTTGTAQAVVVSDQGHDYGVALVPGTQLVPSQTACGDPWLSPDLGGPSIPAGGLCWHGGSASNNDAVLHGNETFALTWDPMRRYWSRTRGYIEQFLRDVADSSGSLGSPYAVATQYRDAGGAAGNRSLYGGGCIDYGHLSGDFTCQFPHAVVTGTGEDYPSGSCTPSGSNLACLTDGDIQSEVTTMVAQMGLGGRIQPHYRPMLVVLIPSGVQVCLDSVGTLCSVGSGATAEFCSYHSSIRVGGLDYSYVVQPWTAYTSCDPPATPDNVPAGARMVSPLSQAEISAITNPWLNGWSANNGSEIDDNGCRPFGYIPDLVKLGGTSYSLAPEFNNAGVLEFDPIAPQCALDVALRARFVVPSPIDAGEVVGFDGSSTASTLMAATTYPWTSAYGYAWSFGDGSTSTGPSVVHSFTQSGYYRVKLTVTDRGGNVKSLTQTVEVLGPDGQPPTTGSGGNKLKVTLQLLPQSMKAVLRNGLAVRVNSNEAANGFATLSIFRSAAHRAHLSSAGNPNSQVVIGRGTVSGVKTGAVSLRVHISSATASKLAHAGQLTLTLHLTLYAKGGGRTTATAVGRY